MTPDQLAALHARCFPGQPRPWHATEFTDLLATPGSFLCSTPLGFLLGRALAGEAELLTLAVAPEARRQGLARKFLHEFADRARALGAEDAFLEVASDNLAAQALYLNGGWRLSGRRRDYYAQGLDALVMTLRLGEVAGRQDC